MTKTQLIEKVVGGALLVVGEYRMSKAEMLRWRDKVNGQNKEAPILRHTVELGSNSVQVNERVPDGTRLEDIHVPFKKGQMIVLAVESYSVDKGAVSCRGHLENYSDGGTVPPDGSGVASPGKRS